MPIKKKDKLKKAFQNGSIPKQEDFYDLIDSMIHRHDSGLVSNSDGLRLSPQGENSTFISFFKTIADIDSIWRLKSRARDDKFSTFELSNKDEVPMLSVDQNGNIGIGTTNPKHKLEVHGSIAMHTRIGIYAKNEIPANGSWYMVARHLTGCHVFEIVAKLNKANKGVHSTYHAIACSAFGKGKNRINETQAYYGSHLNKIEARWEGELFKYTLQLRSKVHLGEGARIRYSIVEIDC